MRKLPLLAFFLSLFILFLSLANYAQTSKGVLARKYAKKLELAYTENKIILEPPPIPVMAAPSLSIALKPTLLDRRASVLHKWLGYVSLLLSVLLLVLDKESRSHRVLGRLFIVSLAMLNISALVIQVHGFTPFHYLAIVSLIIAALGMLPLMLKRTKRSMHLHVVCMFGSIVAVFTGGVTEALVRIPAFPYYGDLPHTVMFAVPTTIVFCLVINILTVERKWREKYIDTSPDE